LDFVATNAAAGRFSAELEDRGVEVRQVGAGNAYAIPAQSAVFPHLEVITRVYAQPALPERVDYYNAADASGCNTPVRTLPFEDLAIRKIACAGFRHHAADYLDLWLMAKARRDAAMAISETLAVRHDESKSSHVPDRPLDIRPFLAIMARLEGKWDNALASLIQPVPAFAIVVSDLKEWLPKLSFAGEEIARRCNL